MRLFTAIPFPDQIKTALYKIQQSFPGGIQTQPVEQMHLTLRFLGEISPETAKSVKKQLNEIEAGAFTLSIKGADTFPQKGKPKIIWVGVRKTEPLIYLQEEIENVCVDNGLDPEKRAYLPHITLGRVKQVSPVLVTKWVDKHEHWVTEKFSVNWFVLFASRLRAEGAIHEKIASYPLDQ